MHCVRSRVHARVRVNECGKRALVRLCVAGSSLRVTACTCLRAHAPSRARVQVCSHVSGQPQSEHPGDRQEIGVCPGATTGLTPKSVWSETTHGQVQVSLTASQGGGQPPVVCRCPGPESAFLFVRSESLLVFWSSQKAIGISRSSLRDGGKIKKFQKSECQEVIVITTRP